MKDWLRLLVISIVTLGVLAIVHQAYQCPSPCFSKVSISGRATIPAKLAHMKHLSSYS